MIKTERFDLNTIDKLAKSLLKSFKTKTVLFYGEMGVGKTTLISSLLKELGSEEKATSPTFSIVNEYKLKNDIVYHFDFYRIKDAVEVLDIGIEEYLYSENWIFIEWPEKICDFLPKYFDILDLKLNKDGTRTLKLSVSDEKSININNN